ncbi:unnamed protein product [Prorocentrum cordatum]|uniref:Uncharacterized protein n=1 Tax=Prorocentrum cordatum TaxID=2364126 RepID=A0ABN9XXI0_9DINO|nr:unnamed protein product [Polarella glacialis]
MRLAPRVCNMVQSGTRTGNIRFIRQHTQVAELSACADELVAVRSEEPREPGGATTAQDLCHELQQYLSDRFCASLGGQLVRVFFVCGTDAAEKSKLYSGVLPNQELGVVVVPRGDEEPRLEVPSRLVFVADPIPGDVWAFSSSRLREAIKGRVHRADLARLLRLIDPSWTEKEMGALMGSAGVSADGTVSPDGFIDWLCSCCQDGVLRDQRLEPAFSGRPRDLRGR